MNSIIEAIFQFLYILIPIITIGLLINVLMKITIRLAGGLAKPMIFATGLIGVPVHELSHVIMCIIFKHKIGEIKLFKPDIENASLGYVTHFYNKKSLYQKAGCFFIGVAPIIIGALSMILLLNLITPVTAYNVSIAMSDNFVSSGTTLNRIVSVFSCTAHMLSAFFNPSSIRQISWWVFSYVACCVAMHMRLSPSDIKGSLTGIVVTIFILFLINLFLLVFFNNASWQSYLNSFYTGCSYIMTMMLFSLFFNIIIVILFTIIGAFRKLFARNNKTAVNTGDDKTSNPL
ncbi:MAG: metalloprotease family protein [Christensenellaceae bacterium]|jgi:hypothetical protein|nr:metalloprotease family protein [Christensenellaceae bacterium]